MRRWRGKSKPSSPGTLQTHYEHVAAAQFQERVRHGTGAAIDRACGPHIIAFMQHPLLLSYMIVGLRLL